MLFQNSTGRHPAIVGAARLLICRIDVFVESETVHVCNVNVLVFEGKLHFMQCRKCGMYVEGSRFCSQCVYKLVERAAFKTP